MFIWTLLPRVATSFKMRVAPRNHFFFFFFFFFEIHMNSSFYWKSHCLSDLWHSCGMTSLIVGSVHARWLAVTTPIPSPPRNYGNGPLIWQLQRQQHLIQMSSSLKPFHDIRVSTQSSSLHSPAACQYICSTATRFVVNFSFEKKKRKRKGKEKEKERGKKLPSQLDSVSVQTWRRTVSLTEMEEIDRSVYVIMNDEKIYIDSERSRISRGMTAEIAIQNRPKRDQKVISWL